MRRAIQPGADGVSRANAERRLRQIRRANRNCRRWAGSADQLAHSPRSLSDSVSGPSCSNLSNQRTAARVGLSSLFPCFRPYISCRLKSPILIGILSRSKRRQPPFQRTADCPRNRPRRPQKSVGNKRHGHLGIHPSSKIPTLERDGPSRYMRHAKNLFESVAQPLRDAVSF